MRLSFGVLLTEYICRRFSINKLKCYQILVLVITFFMYLVYHMSRRSLSIVKPEFNHKSCAEIDVENKTGHADNNYWCNWAPFNEKDGEFMLAWLDNSYLISYAVFMFGAGYVAERSNLRYFLTASLTICGIFSILFGIANPLKIHNIYYFIGLQVMTGVVQATGFPAIVAAVGNWYGKSEKGLIFGIWSLHHNIGNISGTIIAGAFVNYNWGLSFIVPGLFCIGMAVLTFLFLIPGPQYVGLSLDCNSTDDKLNESESPDNQDHDNNEPISFFGALKLPGVIAFSICLFFAKLVVFTFLYWLPQYINETIDVPPSWSAYMTISFDVGGSAGAILAGYLADRTGTSAIVCIGFLTSAIPSLSIFYKWGSESIVCNQFLQFIAGMCVFGPYSLIVTAVSADLGSRVKSKSAMATVTSIIDGTGSIGAAVGPTMAGYLD